MSRRVARAAPLTGSLGTWTPRAGACRHNMAARLDGTDVREQGRCAPSPRREGGTKAGVMNPGAKSGVEGEGVRGRFGGREKGMADRYRGLTMAAANAFGTITVSVIGVQPHVYTHSHTARVTQVG